MELEDFLPKYPTIRESKLNFYGLPFNDAIVSKTEFSNLKLKKEQGQKVPGEYYDHQNIIARYLSNHTLYDRLLIYHEMGTGKTCTAVNVIETIRQDPANVFKGSIIILKGFHMVRNFINEFFFACTAKKYLPKNWDSLTDIQKINQMRNLYKEFYTFVTFDTFAKQLKNMSEADIKQKFSQHIIVIDEVHNIKVQVKDKVLDPRKEDIRKILNREQINVYKELFRFLHTVEEVKIMLMSGTPMRDDVSEFASTMNLILPLDEQFITTGNAFKKRYFDDNTLRASAVQELRDKLRGRVSYLKNANSTVKKTFKGATQGKLKHFIVQASTMSAFQSTHYMAALQEDSVDNTIYLNSRQAALFVFPDGSHGNKGSDKFLTNTKMTQPLRNALAGANNAARIAALQKHSSKFAFVVDTILNTRGKSIVYCEFVNGGGCILLTRILELFGFSGSAGKDRTPGRRYALLTNQATTDAAFQSIIRAYNDPNNIDGDFIAVIVGSRVISEGYTFKNVDREFILTPHWNYSETEQVIARGLRIGSHDERINRGDRDVEVSIYQQVALPLGNPPPTRDITSIDLHMYEIAEQKDILIKQLERLVKTSSFDCPLTKLRNTAQAPENSRECEYQPCDYTCDGRITLPPDNSTNNLYYLSVDKTSRFLKNYFMQNSTITLDTLRRELSRGVQITPKELAKTIQTLLHINQTYNSKYAANQYLRMDNDTLFLMNDPLIPLNEPLMLYYHGTMTVRAGKPFKSIVNELYSRQIPNMLDALATQPADFLAIMNVLPLNIQRLLLETAILAQIRVTLTGVALRKRLLDTFKTYYTQTNNTWIVWLHYAELKSFTELVDGKWVQRQDLDVVTSLINKQQKQLSKSTIGYYGQENPTLNEFCLREVEALPAGDLRRLRVGRRCINFVKPKLVDILANRIKRPIDDRMYLNYNSDEQVMDMIDKVFEKVDPKDNVVKPRSRSAQIRFLFYNEQSRSELCALIKEWFERNDLIEQNFNCGTSRKTRKTP